MAEYDNFLEESAGSILGPLAGIAGGAVFLPKIEPILPKLLKKLVSGVFTCPPVREKDDFIFYYSLLSLEWCQFYNRRQVLCCGNTCRGQHLQYRFPLN